MSEDSDDIEVPNLYEYVGIPRRRAAGLYLHTIEVFRETMRERRTIGDLVVRLAKIADTPTEAAVVGFVAAMEYGMITQYVRNEQVEEEMRKLACVEQPREYQ